MTRSRHRGARGPLVSDGVAARGRWDSAAVSWAALGSKRRWADWLAGGPISTVTFPFFL
jgi:hypothetical protein